MKEAIIYRSRQRAAQILVLLVLFLALPAVARGVTVCVLDSGCNLPGIRGWNYLSDTGDLTDDAGHGTGICELLHSLSPEADLVALKCFGAEESFDEAAVVAALYDAVDEYQADIAILCWTIAVERDTLREAIQYAAQAGTILVAPAGNLSLSTGVGARIYPALWPEVIGVGGVDLDAQGQPEASLWYLASDAVYVCARGDWGTEKGSSYAVPRVAAVIADYLTQTPDASLPAVQEMLRLKALDLGAPGYDTTYGWGYIQADLPDDEKAPRVATP